MYLHVMLLNIDLFDAPIFAGGEHRLASKLGKYVVGYWLCRNKLLCFINGIIYVILMFGM